MLTQLPLPLLPPDAAEIAPGVGVVTGAEGGLVLVHGLATFAWDAGDEAGRRRAAGPLDRLRAAGQAPGAGAFGVGPGAVGGGGRGRAGRRGEGAVRVCAAGARYPLAGLLLALPALQAAGLLGCARQVYGGLRAGFYGLDAALLTLVFLALAGEPRAEGATRVPPAALGRVRGLDRAPEVKTIRRKLAELAGAGKATELVMALARHHAAARPEALGFLYADGHHRGYFGPRQVQKTHVARLKFPAPATAETWVTDSGGDPVFMVVAEPSASLAGEVKGLLPKLRRVIGDGRRVTVCFDRGGWSPALFADIIAAGFDLLTYRKGPAPDLPAAAFTTITCAADRGQAHAHDLADTTITLDIPD